MRLALFSLLCGVFLSTAPLASADAQAPGDSVRLFLVPEEVVVGGLLERTPEAWRVALPDRDPRLVPNASVRRAEVRVVRTRRELRSKSMFRGMLIGTAAMVAVYVTEIGNEPGDPGLAGMLIVPLAASGALYGAGVGWVVGSFLPEVKWQTVR